MNKFSKYGLIANPFSEERHDFPMIGRGEEWNNIRDVLGELLRADSCGIMIIFGDYGMGKTFTLVKLREWINNSKPPSPKGNVLPVFLKTSGSQLPSNYLSDLLIRLIREIGKESLEEITKRTEFASLKIDESLRNIFENLSKDEPLAWNWLIGRNISKTELTEIGATYKITEGRETYSIFEGFLKILKAGGYGNLVILLDEWEYLLSMASSNKIRSVVHDLQQVWDSYNEAAPKEREQMCKVIFLIGSSVGAWRIFLEMIEVESDKKGGGGTDTFMRRIPKNATITLSPLKDNDIQKFLSNRLKAYREKQIDDPLFPFDANYVKFISSVSWGIPSSVLSYSALIIKEAAEKENIKKIDAKFGEEVLRQHGLLRELEEAKPSV